MSKETINKVFLWPNGLAMVFDVAGNQMPEYQRADLATRTRIVEDAPSFAKFYVGEPRGEVARISRDSFRQFMSWAPEEAEP